MGIIQNYTRSTYRLLAAAISALAWWLLDLVYCAYDVYFNDVYILGGGGFMWMKIM